MTPKIYVVGGAVRDILLEKTPKDIDYVVVGADAAYMTDVLKLEAVHAGFNIFLDKDRNEYSLARNLKNECVPENTLDEDMASRDLTINAMAFKLEDFQTIYNILKEHNWNYKTLYNIIPKHIITNKMLIDYNGGLRDLRNEKFKAVVGFHNDPVRVLRLARLYSIYGNRWVMSDSIYEVVDILKKSGKFQNLPAERITKELEYVFTYSKNPLLFFSILNIFGIIEDVFPGLTIDKILTSNFGKFLVSNQEHLKRYDFWVEQCFVRFYMMYAKKDMMYAKEDIFMLADSKNRNGRVYPLHEEVVSDSFEHLMEHFKFSADMLHILKAVESFNNMHGIDIHDSSSHIYKTARVITAADIVYFFNMNDFFRKKEFAKYFLDNYVPYRFADFYRVIKDISFKDLSKNDAKNLKGRDITNKINEIKIKTLDKYIFEQIQMYPNVYEEKIINILDHSTFIGRIRNYFKHSHVGLKKG